MFYQPLSIFISEFLCSRESSFQNRTLTTPLSEGGMGGVALAGAASLQSTGVPVLSHTGRSEAAIRYLNNKYLFVIRHRGNRHLLRALVFRFCVIPDGAKRRSGI